MDLHIKRPTWGIVLCRSPWWSGHVYVVGSGSIQNQTGGWDFKHERWLWIELWFETLAQCSAKSSYLWAGRPGSWYWKLHMPLEVFFFSDYLKYHFYSVWLYRNTVWPITSKKWLVLEIFHVAAMLLCDWGCIQFILIKLGCKSRHCRICSYRNKFLFFITFFLYS